MSEKISVVTDSTASLPRELAIERNIDVIPAVITFKDKSFRDGVDIGMDEFMKLLKKIFYAAYNSCTILFGLYNGLSTTFWKYYFSSSR